MNDDILDSVMHQFTDLPPRGKPAAELTERDRLELALAAGAKYRMDMDGTRLTVTTTQPVGIADRGDGGYVIAIGPEPARKSLLHHNIRL